MEGATQTTPTTTSTINNNLQGKMSDVEGIIQVIIAFLAFLAAVERTEAAAVNVKPKPDLLTHFSRIDELTAQLPSDTDRELMHYLAKKSYAKALLYLEGRQIEIEKGTCLR